MSFNIVEITKKYDKKNELFYLSSWMLKSIGYLFMIWLSVCVCEFVFCVCVSSVWWVAWLCPFFASFDLLNLQFPSNGHGHTMINDNEKLTSLTRKWLWRATLRDLSPWPMGSGDECDMRYENENHFHDKYTAWNSEKQTNLAVIFGRIKLHFKRMCHM